MKRLNHFTNEEVCNNGLFDEPVTQNCKLILHAFDSLENPVRYLADGIFRTISLGAVSVELLLAVVHTHDGAFTTDDTTTAHREFTLDATGSLVLHVGEPVFLMFCRCMSVYV